jgi:glycosyltransferase involved in cell wall biosynthesis
MKTIDFALTASASGHRVLDPKTFPEGDDFGGGSRAGFMGLVRAMARRGDYRVRAISTFNLREQTHDGVEYVRLDRAENLSTPDILFAYYDTSPLVGSKAECRIASHHTLIPFMAAWDWSDIQTAPCSYAVEHLRRGFAPKSQWHVLPNAVEGLEHVERRPVPGRVIYHTSPDRGLDELLGIWAGIREHVPYATLHVGGDVLGMIETPAPPRSVRARLIERTRQNLRLAQAAGGVKLLGRLPRPELLRELAEASCFAFPASVMAPCETWSVSVQEACHIGLPVLLCPVDALSMWEPYVRMVHGQIEQHRSEFASELVRLLLDHDEARWLSEKAVRVRPLFTFDKSAERLHKIISGD